MDSGERRHVNDHRARALQRFPRHDRRGEARLPAVLATLAAVLLYLVLPEQLLFVPRFVLPGLELLLLIPLIAVNPRRMTRQRPSAPNCPSPTSGSPRTRTTTPSRRSPTAPPAPATGYPP
ncbi:hypothetical protein [Kitasatospora phosalacinea]|uniref:hypothetical protein n=1 Tax=Kitasatospora phosalacinea TaxID=2065 RepID=UPI00068A079C|nr:hypothetical protein [Kitasatospora phosalacinea]